MNPDITKMLNQHHLDRNKAWFLESKVFAESYKERLGTALEGKNFSVSADEVYDISGDTYSGYLRSLFREFFKN